MSVATRPFPQARAQARPWTLAKGMALFGAATAVDIKI